MTITKKTTFFTGKLNRHGYMIYLTGFADEAGRSLSTQIKATKELGWKYIESRNIDSVNLHNLPEDKFEDVVNELEKANVRVNCFGSTIANWAKQITDPFEETLEEVDRAVSRMKLLGTKLIRIMSYARLPEGKDQQAEERFRCLRIIVNEFLKNDLVPLHENCMNYGGMSWKHSLNIVENVPGLDLIYDTGNSPFMKDYSKEAPYPYQNGFEFYQNVKKHVKYIHVKDSYMSDKGEEVFTMPGEGNGHVVEILKDLKESGYKGGISIEPHLASVFHDPSKASANEEESFRLYVEYGEKLMKILDELQFPYNEEVIVSSENG